MPIYLYKCSNCGANIEKMQSVTADQLVVCPECHHSTLKKVMTAAGIIFKGSGWYVTDSRKSPATTTAANADKSEGGEKAGAEKPATEKAVAEKPAAEAKSESKSSEPA